MFAVQDVDVLDTMRMTSAVISCNEAVGCYEGGQAVLRCVFGVVAKLMSNVSRGEAQYGALL